MKVMMWNEMEVERNGNDKIERNGVERKKRRIVNINKGKKTDIHNIK